MFAVVLLLTELFIVGLFTMINSNTSRINQVQQQVTQYKAQTVTRAELTETFRRFEQKLDELFKDVHTRNH